MFVAENDKKGTFIVARCVYFYRQPESTASLEQNEDATTEE